MTNTCNYYYYLMDYISELGHITYGTNLLFLVTGIFIDLFYILLIYVYTFSSVKIILFIQPFMYC